MILKPRNNTLNPRESESTLGTYSVLTSISKTIYLFSSLLLKNCTLLGSTLSSRKTDSASDFEVSCSNLHCLTVGKSLPSLGINC